MSVDVDCWITRYGRGRLDRERHAMKSALLEGELYDPEGNFIDDIIDDKDAGFRVKVKSGRRQQQSQQLSEAQKVERPSPELSFKGQYWSERSRSLSRCSTRRGGSR